LTIFSRRYLKMMERLIIVIVALASAVSLASAFTQIQNLRDRVKYLEENYQPPEPNTRAAILPRTGWLP
jgi:hypothetical protein